MPVRVDAMTIAPPAPERVLADLWALGGLPADALSRVQLTGSDPVLPSSFAVGTVAQASIAAAGLAAAEIGRLRGGPAQTVAVDMRHAAIEFRSERYLRVGGEPAPELWDSIAGLYACGDGRWVRLHTNFPHHRDGILRLLGCEGSRDAVARALAGWTGYALEDAAAQAGMVATAFRTFDEWDAHPQGQAVAALPLISLERLDDSAPRGLPPGERPLSGVRVLDLTRIIAGPVCGRTLAAHGADVLLVSGPHLPAIAPLVMDTGRGKRCCHVDLRDAAGREQLTALLAQADVWVQGYRPGGLAERGFGPEAAAQVRPGIVYVSLSAYGHTGPWAPRRGFDSLVQTASGLNDAEAQAAGQTQPRPLPAQALDHAAGYLMAYGAMAALARRATEGGSWHVRVSLAGVGHWLRSLGRVADGLAATDPGQADVADLMVEQPSGFGPLLAVSHAAQLSHTPAWWTLPSMPLGSYPPAWW